MGQKWGSRPQRQWTVVLGPASEPEKYETLVVEANDIAGAALAAGGFMDPQILRAIVPISVE